MVIAVRLKLKVPAPEPLVVTPATPTVKVTGPPLDIPPIVELVCTCKILFTNRSPLPVSVVISGDKQG